MKIWILTNGERSGPHETFAIRERISEGELDADTPAWYEGIPEWVTLRDVPSLSGLFIFKDDEISEQQVYEDFYQSEEQPVLPAAIPLHPVQRFFARFFDLFVYSLLFVLILILCGVDPYTEASTYGAAMRFMPYVIIDAIFIHIWAASPGKMLLGVKVHKVDGKNLGIGGSLLRSLRVWVLGFGMFIVWFIAIPISYLLARKFGKFIWDVPKNYQVSVKPIRPKNIVIYVLILFSVVVLVSSFLPQEYQNMTFQELLEKTAPQEK